MTGKIEPKPQSTVKLNAVWYGRKEPGYPDSQLQEVITTSFTFGEVVEIPSGSDDAEGRVISHVQFFLTVEPYEETK